MAWSVWSCDTVSGVKLAQLPVNSFPWARVLGVGGSGSASIPLLDEGVRELDVEMLTREVSTTLVLDWDGSVRYAGIITGQPEYDHSSGTLSVAHSDLWWLWKRRLAADFSVPVTAAATKVYTNLSRGTMAKRQVQLGITGPVGDNASLPITLPSDVADATGVRTFYGYRFAMVADVVADLMKEDGGLEVDFEPRWVGGKLDWLMRVGVPGAPKLSGPSWEWNLTAEQHGLSGLKINRNTERMVTASYGMGEGQGVDGLYRSNRIVPPVYPTLHRVESYSSVTDATVLEGIVNANLQQFKVPTEQWSASVVASGMPGVNDLVLGGTGRFFTEGMYRVADGWSSRRLIQFSGDLSENVKLQFQATGGV